VLAKGKEVVIELGNPWQQYPSKFKKGTTDLLISPQGETLILDINA